MLTVLHPEILDQELQRWTFAVKDTDSVGMRKVISTSHKLHTFLASEVEMGWREWTTRIFQQKKVTCIINPRLFEISGFKCAT